jgi:hypothetical protein
MANILRHVESLMQCMGTIVSLCATRQCMASSTVGGLGKPCQLGLYYKYLQCMCLYC